MSKNKKFSRSLTIDKAIAPEVKEETAAILNASVENKPDEAEEKKEEAVTVKGYVDVADGTTLNIRKVPQVRPNNQIAILGKGIELTVIDPDNPIDSEGELWLKVRVNEDDEEIGYAMKKFIKIIVEA